MNNTFAKIEKNISMCFAPGMDCHIMGGEEIFEIFPKSLKKKSL